ncbi:MAG: putative PurR-regulated permease PerM [Ilumatobacter sp.]
MDPVQQVRVVRCIGPTVGGCADHTFVHAMHDVDGLLCFRSRAERRRSEEVGGALQSAPWIVAEIGVFRDPCHGERVQRLEQQGAHAANEHRRVRVHAPDWRVIIEPARLVGVEQFHAPNGGVGAHHPISDLGAEPFLDPAHGGCQPGAYHSIAHWLIVPRPADYHPSVPEDSETDVDRTLPRWLIPGITIFWTGFLLTFVARHVFHRLADLLILLLVSLFVALAIEPGVNKLAARGWRRGRATVSILLGVLLAFLVFLIAIGTLVGGQIADLLSESDVYIVDTVTFLNDTFGTQINAQAVIDEVNDPNGRVQQFIQGQGDEAVRLSLTAVGVIFQGLSALLFTYYLVADGPRLRRVICSRLTPTRQARVLNAWELAINKTGGYLYSRALLALLSAFFHWVVFQSIGTQAPIALALWVGLVSQFLPVVGTYLAGILPVLVTFLDSPFKAAIVIGFIVVYQQVENYFFAPRITARTMELHPAVAFGAALAGASLLGAVGAILALPAAAMAQALASEWGQRYDVVDSHLTTIQQPRRSTSTEQHPSSQDESTQTP